MGIFAVDVTIVFLICLCGTAAAGAKARVYIVAVACTITFNLGPGKQRDEFYMLLTDNGKILCDRWWHAALYPEFLEALGNEVEAWFITPHSDHIPVH